MASDSKRPAAPCPAGVRAYYGAAMPLPARAFAATLVFALATSCSSGSTPVATTPVADCDPLDPSVCALPWPSSLYLVRDPSRATGNTLTFGATTLPINVQDAGVDPAPYRRMDGYDVGAPIMTLFPSLDVTGMATEADLAPSMAPDAKVLLFRVEGATLVRVPYWVELDAGESDPDKRVLFVRPGVILEEASRYVVAFRDLVRLDASPVPSSEAFLAFRDHRASTDVAVTSRRRRFEEVFALLEGAGVDRASLTLAWDFETASDDAMHGRLLRMRDEALAEVGASGPPLVVTSVTEYAPTNDGSGRPIDPNIALEIQGTFETPSWLSSFPATFGDAQGLTLDAHDYHATREPGTTWTRTFLVRIPYSALPASPGGQGTPHKLLQYGHGLLGSTDELRTSYLGALANANGYILFGASMAGLDVNELLIVLGAANSISDFRAVADTLHQGLVDWVVLARAVRQRLGALPELTTRGIAVDATRLHYYGNSQGGIMGSTYMAITPEITRGVAGVPGNNFGLLMERSHDFDQFLAQVRVSYPRRLDQPVLLAAVGLLWTSTDPVSHLRHLSLEPYAGNEPHYLLMTPAKGDHQVSPLTNEVLARSDFGIPLLANYDDERTPFACPQAAYPHVGSGIMLFDFGNEWPWFGNRVTDDTGTDPHEAPRRSAAHDMAMMHFFDTGEIVDVCGGDGCHPN